MKANKCAAMQYTSVANASATTKWAEKLIIKVDQLEMYTKNPCITLTGLSNEESEDLSSLKQDVVDTLSKTGLSKEKISKKYWQITQGNKNWQNKNQNTIIKSKAHSFKERNFFKWKIIKRKHFKNQTVTC